MKIKTKPAAKPIGAVNKAGELAIREAAIADLKPYPQNARTHSEWQVRAIANSINEFGFVNPVLVDGALGVIAGHGRIEAAKLLGMTVVPVIVLGHLTDAQRRALVIADNQIALGAGWDENMLRIELVRLRDDDVDLSILGFERDDLSRLMGDAATPEEPPLPPTPKVPISRPGDVWVLGEHRVMCGDATSETMVAALCASAPADACWTDPPYNVDYEGAAGKIANDHMEDGAFRAFLTAAFAAAAGAIRPGGAIYVAHADTEGLNFRAAFKAAGFKLSGCLIWVKPSLVLGRSDYQWRHEPILYGWKPGAKHRWFGGRDKTTVFEIDKPARNEEHPTMKPVELIRQMLMNSTKQGDAVLDPFGGSGSTLMACEGLGRRARLMELEPAFVDVIVRRWMQASGQEAVLEATGAPWGDVEFERIGPAKAA